MKRFIRRNIKLLTIIGFVIIAGSIGLTLALRLNFDTTSISGTAADVVANVTYAKDGNNNDITSVTSSGALIPITIDTSNVNNVLHSSEVGHFNFGVTGVSANPNNSIYDISLVNIDVACELKNEYVKWVLYKDNIRIATGNFSNTFDKKQNNRMVLTSTQQDLTTTKDEYLLAIYIEESNSVDLSSLLGKTLTANISIETATGTKKVNTRSTSTNPSCTGNNTSVAKPECADNLVYNGTTLNLIKNNAVPSGVTVSQNTAITPGDYTVTAKLGTGYIWSDDSTEDYVFTCNVAKRPITISSIDQFGSSFMSIPAYISATNLLTGHTVNSIKLTRIATLGGDDIIAPSMAVIYDTGSNNITDYYAINYQSLGKVVGLPSGYTQLSYIEGTGSQYIDTSIYFDYSQDFRIIGKVINPDASKRKVIIGCYKDDNNSSVSMSIEFGGSSNSKPGYLRNWFQLANNVKTNIWSEAALSTNVEISYETSYNSSNSTCSTTATYGGNTISFNGSTGSSSTVSQNPLRFFLDHRANKTDIANPVKIGPTTIFKNDVLVGNFIPCKNSSDVVGMYDIVSGTFYTNNGSGTFGYVE